MKVIFFSRLKTVAQKRLAAELADRLGSGVLTSFHTFYDLDTCLRRPGNPPAVLVLFPSGLAEMERLLAMHALLEGWPVLVVLPDESPRLVTAALKLHPRFLDFSYRDFSNVTAVIRKMIAKRSLPESGLSGAPPAKYLPSGGPPGTGPQHHR